MSIKENEIRIGNIVWNSLSEKEIVVQGISNSKESYGGYYYIEHGDGSRTAMIDHTDNESFIHGIPLTEEWLLKFGFKKSEAKRYYQETMLFELFNITALDSGFKIIAGRKRQDGVILQISEEIQSVHQLQNLYHALTGQELTI